MKAHPQLSLMPMPSHVVLGEGSLVIGSGWDVRFESFQNERLVGAIKRTIARLRFEAAPAGVPDVLNANGAVQLTIDVEGAGQPVQDEYEDESYSLKVSRDSVVLKSQTVVGALRGLETLLQLCTLQDGKYVLPEVSIDDAPRFHWRGLLIDSARHFLPVPVVLRTIDGMAAVKLNVLHWHLSDDQGFRVESHVFPKLQQMGSDGHFYTQAEIRGIVAYATARGVRIVPEFDMPAHAASMFVGYPALASMPGEYKLWGSLGPSLKEVDPTRESTYQFIDAFVGEMAGLFPDKYWHVGGDETVAKQWKANPAIIAFMRDHDMKDPPALQAYFNHRLYGILAKHGKRMMGWDEILQPDLPRENLILESWRGQKTLVAAAQQQYKVVYSSAYYLNFMRSAEALYLSDPVPQNEALTPRQEAYVLGGEICMWGEMVDGTTIDGVVWPRAAAIAERFWSPKETRDVDDMYRRLRIASLRLESEGLTHISAPQRLLRDLDAKAFDDLAEFVSLLDPVNHHERSRAEHPDVHTPMNRFGDAVVPDPPTRYEFEKQVREFLSTPNDSAKREALLNRFRDWQALATRVEPILRSSPRMATAAPQAERLRRIAVAGRSLVECLANGNCPPAQGMKDITSTLDEASQPTGLTRFTFILSLEKLLQACRQ